METVTRLEADTKQPGPKEWAGQVIGTSDATSWLTWMDSIKESDVFTTHGYVSFLEEVAGNKAQLYVYGNREDYIAYPFFLRPLSDLPLHGASDGDLDSEAPLFDIESPYGYSGPMAHVEHPEVTERLWKEFLAQFSRYCAESSIVSEFGRLNPFIGNHEPLSSLTDGVHQSGEVVYADLTQSDEQLWRQLNRGNKSKIHLARRSGVTIVEGSRDEDLEEFSRLYTRTMERRGAAPWYRFGPGFAFRLRERLGDRLQQFSAKIGGRTVAAALFVHASDVLHYFLGGSDERHFSSRANNLLMFEAIIRAKDLGLRVVNLGGGHRPGDTLLQFKRSFSKLTLPFYTYKAIHMPGAYQELTALAVANRGAGESETTHEFFPAYRVR